MAIRTGMSVLLLVTAVCSGGAVAGPVRAAVAQPQAAGAQDPPAQDPPAQDPPAQDRGAQDEDAQDVDAPGPDAMFRDELRPLLEAQCFECHGPEVAKPKGRLRMTGRDALLKGGASGPALVPFDADRSLLVSAVRYTDPDLEMPPENRLDAAQVALIERWVAAGAPWPEQAGAALTPEQAGAAPTPEQARHFEEQVRPLLAEHCFRCHGPAAEKLKGGLRMTGHAALLAGGDTGPAVVPGDADRSRLVRAVRYTDSELQMPPDGRLRDADIALLEAWVADGAPWPAYDDLPPAPADEHGIDVQAGRTWWSFRPVVRPEPPGTAFDARAANDIDRFVFARLEAAGLSPAPLADPAALVRRLSFDLLGLPPREEDVLAYASDPSPAAWMALVDELLARPEYGERWARHWLDVVRYAQTNGYERDEEKPYAWRFRDYVIDAFNRDVPWNRFVQEQVAGDELDEVTADSLIATGFYRLGVWDDEPDDRAQARYDELDDMLRTIGEGFLGVTLACARCHDHKFDPFRQLDYYGTLAFVQNVSRYKLPEYSLQSPVLTPVDLDWNSASVWERERAAAIAEMQTEQAVLREKGRLLATEAALAALSPEVRRARALPPEERTPGQQTLLQAVAGKPITTAQSEAALPDEDRRRLGRLKGAIEEAQKSFAGSLRWALTVKEDGPWRPATQLLIRGQASSPGPRVEPAFPAVLAASDLRAQPELPAPSAARNTVGRRRVLADWIVAPENPLTARVLVNRVWQHHFGRGLVPTPNDFGAAGEPPSHPELLDWLADEFVRGGWSVKRLHRLILASHTWRQASAPPAAGASAAPSAAAFARGRDVDPGNALLWRQNLRRLEAEALRDSLLAVSGRLNGERGGRGYFPYLSREVLSGGSRPGEGWAPETQTARERRSIYAYVKRNLADPLIESFDGANTSLPVASRATTTVPSQALVLLNGDFLNEQAAAFAERVAREVAGGAAAGGAAAGGAAVGASAPGALVDRAWRLALARAPTPAEHALALAYLESAGRALDERKPDLAFRLAMPQRVESDFLALLSGSDILHAPPGWESTRGVWGDGYNKTYALDPGRGPVAFAPGPAVSDFTLLARVRLPEAEGVAGLVLRGTPQGDDVESLELLLDRQAGVARLVHHHADAIDVLAETPASLPAETWFDVRVEARGESLSASVRVPAGAAVGAAADASAGAAGAVEGAAGRQDVRLEARAPGLVPEGRPGVRAAGDTLRIASLTITTPTGTHTLRAADPGPARRALESLCLMLFNLNEFAYVD